MAEGILEREMKQASIWNWEGGERNLEWVWNLECRIVIEVEELGYFIS